MDITYKVINVFLVDQVVVKDVHQLVVHLDLLQVDQLALLA